MWYTYQYGERRGWVAWLLFNLDGGGVFFSSREERWDRENRWDRGELRQSDVGQDRDGRGGLGGGTEMRCGTGRRARGGQRAKVGQ